MRSFPCPRLKIGNLVFLHMPVGCSTHQFSIHGISSSHKNPVFGCPFKKIPCFPLSSFNLKQTKVRYGFLHPAMFLSFHFQSCRSFGSIGNQLNRGGEEEETDTHRIRTNIHRMETNLHRLIIAMREDAPRSEFSSTGRMKKQPDVSLLDIFRREKEIVLVVDLLKKGMWNHEVERSLDSLPVTFDVMLVMQVLRVDVPCDIILKFFHWVRDSRNGFKHNEFTYSVMLNTLGRMGLLEEMQEILNEMKSDNSSCTITRVILSNVMLWFSKAGDMNSISLHWNAVRREGIKPSSAMYAVYLDYLIIIKEYAKIAAIFEEMLRMKCLPSSRTYTVFIKHLVDIGNFHGGAQVLKLMQTIRVIPSRATYEILINGFVKARNVDMVLQLLNEMREHFHMPSKHLMLAIKDLQVASKLKESYSSLWEEIWQELECFVMNEKDMVDDAEDELEDSMSVWKNVTCKHVGFDINAFSQALHKWNPRVEEILDCSNMQWPNSLVLEILRRIRNLDSFWSFFHWLKDNAGFKHSAYTSALMIQKILKSRTSLGKKAFLIDELFEGLKKDGMHFTTPMFNMVIRFYVCVGEAEKAYTMFNHIKEFELEPNNVSYTLVIQGFAKNCQEKKAMSLFRDMEEKGFCLDSTTCADLITCLGKAGKTERAYTIFNKILECGGSHGPYEYKAIMEAYSRIGDNGMALKVYEDMCKTGIMPTQDMYEVVTRILRKSQRQSDLDMLIQERNMLDFFNGNNKFLQETLLRVLFLFMEGIKSRNDLEMSFNA